MKTGKERKYNKISIVPDDVMLLDDEVTMMVIMMLIFQPTLIFQCTLPLPREYTAVTKEEPQHKTNQTNTPLHLRVY